MIFNETPTFICSWCSSDHEIVKLSYIFHMKCQTKSQDFHSLNQPPKFWFMDSRGAEITFITSEITTSPSERRYYLQSHLKSVRRNPADLDLWKLTWVEISAVKGFIADVCGICNGKSSLSGHLLSEDLLREDLLEKTCSEKTCSEKTSSENTCSKRTCSEKTCSEKTWSENICSENTCSCREAVLRDLYHNRDLNSKDLYIKDLFREYLHSKDHYS